MTAKIAQTEPPVNTGSPVILRRVRGLGRHISGCLKITLSQGLLDYCETHPEHLLRIVATGLNGLNRKLAIIQKCQAFVKANYRDPGLSLNQIATEVGLGSVYVSTLFKAITGINLTGFIHQVRIAEAKRLLDVNEKIPMVRVANLVGFSGGEHFGRIFKRITGTSPLRYRKCGKETHCTAHANGKRHLVSVTPRLPVGNLVSPKTE